MYLSRTLGAVATLAIAAGAHAGMATTTVVDFEDGTTQGWQGPMGPGGTTFIDETAGVGGSAGYRTQFNNFGISFDNDANEAFLGDYGQFDSVTLGVDVQVEEIGSFNPVSRP